MFSGRVLLIVVLKAVKYEVYLCVNIYIAAKYAQDLCIFAQVLCIFSGCVYLAPIVKPDTVWNGRILRTKIMCIYTGRGCEITLICNI